MLATATRTTAGGTTICSLSGELDAFNASSARQAMAALAGSPAVVIDLAGVVFMDSSGLGVLVGGVRRIRELGGDIAVCSPSTMVGRVLRVAGLNRIVDITDTVDEAVASLGAASHV